MAPEELEELEVRGLIFSSDSESDLASDDEHDCFAIFSRKLEERSKMIQIIKDIEEMLFYENYKTKSIHKLLDHSIDENIEYFSKISEKKKLQRIQYYKTKLEIILEKLLILNKMDPRDNIYLLMIKDISALRLLLDKIEQKKID